MTHESVTVNVSGELTDVVYAAGQAMHGAWITIKNGVTTNVTGGSGCFSGANVSFSPWMKVETGNENL